MTAIPPELQSIHHDGSARYVSNPYPALGETVTLRVRTGLDAPVLGIALRTAPDEEQHWTPLVPAGQDAACRWWEVALPITMPVVRYRFTVRTPTGLWTLNGRGLWPHITTDFEDFRLVADYAAPGWVRDTVFYQIFPDRFADGDPTTNVRTGEWTVRGHTAQARAWDTMPDNANPGFEFYGGDLPGIVDRLPYLADLGVNALYLNPIFRAPSVHRYDVVSYEEVDPHLGGNAGLAALRAALDAQGMRLMLDIVPNHCGAEHPWFLAARADAASPYAAYFFWNHHPDDYGHWLNARSLPKLNYAAPALRATMYAGPDSIFRRWLRPPYRIDAWRVDVANMLGQHGPERLGPEITRGIRAAVKEENPAAYLIGENFFDATPQLQGDQYDGNMNYRGFTVPLWEWLHPQPLPVPAFGPGVRSARLPTTGLVDTWAAFRAPIPYVIALQQFTLVDSHDTARIRSQVGGSAALQRLAAAIQCTYPGVPCIYYGDEIGLEAATANLARRTMPWDEAAWDQDLRAFYRRLIHLRRNSAALATGGFQVLYSGTNTVAYLRDTDAEQVVLVGYRGEGVRPAAPLPVAHGGIADGTCFVEIFSGATAVVSGGALPLPTLPQGAAIWRAGAA